MAVRINAPMSRLITVIVLIVLPVLTQTAAAQIPVDVDFGIRGGVFNGGGIPLQVSNNHYFPDSYTTDTSQFPVTAGPTIGVLLNGRWYARFEAARSRFRIHFQQGTNSYFPYSGLPQVTSVSDGQAWQYPLLLTYMAGHGTVRPFGGGGVSFGATFTGTTRTTTTTLVGPRPGPGATGPFNTMSTTSSAPFDNRYGLAPHAYYITGGVDARVSLLSIRPELRYTHWTGFDKTSIDHQDDTFLFSENQVEFLLSITAHPFRRRHQKN
jgi:hypothetical protein